MYRDGGDYRTSREFRGARAEYGYDRHDRGLHRGWYKDRGERTVIIKKRHRHWDDWRNGPLTGAIFVSSFPRENGAADRMIVGLPLKGKIASISTVAKGAYLIYEGKLAKAGKIAMVSTMRPRRDFIPRADCSWSAVRGLASAIRVEGVGGNNRKAE
jgi:hypothetical protein